MSRKKINVGFIVDGSFLPIRNGAYYSIYNLMNSLYNTGIIQPNLIIRYRGWDNPKLFFNKKFRTIFLPNYHYYRDTGELNYILNRFEIKFVHIYNSEEVLNLGIRLKRNGIKIIYEAINIDHILYGRLNNNKKKNNKIKLLQKKAMECADYVLCRSKIDFNHIIKMGIKRKNIYVYCGAIDTARFEYLPRIKKNYKLVFLGHMYYPPNESVLKFIAVNILPKLKVINPKYSITILGTTPKEIMDKYKKIGIAFKGGVDNLSEELLKYNIALAPLKEGSGTRLKILDYMASGLPVITTDLGIEGLKKEIKNFLVIENNIDEYPRVIDAMMRNLDKYVKICFKGRKFLEKNYDWKNNLKTFLNIYKQYDKQTQESINRGI